MNPLRIGYDVTPLAGHRTGVGNYTEAVLRQMTSHASDFEFRCLSTGRHRVNLAAYPGVTLHRHVPLPTRVMYKLWDLTGQPRADRLLSGVDVFHATNYFLPPVAAARAVLSIYDLAFLKHPEWCSPRIVGPFSRGVRRFAHRADAIVACSEATRADIVTLLGIPPERVRVVYGAVNDAAPAPPPAEAARLLETRYNLRGPFVLFVSTLEPRKNIEGLLRAFAQAASRIPHQLLLVGATGWGMEALPQFLASLGLGDRVRQLGYVADPAHLPAFYAAADAFFFPSHYEGFGLPVLEAMTHGCPVITSRTSSLPEVAGDAARYVDPNNVEAMAEALCEVALDETLRAAMRERGLEQSRKFSWATAATQTLDLYRSLT